MTDWTFWLTAGVVAAAVAAAMFSGLRRGAASGGTSDVAVYREQLREVDRDLDRAIIAPAEAERLRTEVSRRLLDAEGARRGATVRGPLAGILLLVAGVAAAFPIYLSLGAPGYRDLPIGARIAAADRLRANRPSQAEAAAAAPERPAPAVDPEYAALMNKLRTAVAANPDDLQGWRLLARNEIALGNFADGAAAQARVVALGDGNASDRAAEAEALILAANGYVSPEAERVLTGALERDPAEPLALYYSGSMMIQLGREDLAFRFWRKLLDVAPPEAGYVDPVRAAMPDLAARAGAAWDEGPRATVGPTEDQIDAMSALPPEDRAAAIEGMVRQLNDRLANRGGTAEEWARLIAAYGVLGQQDRAAQIWSEARQLFTNETQAAIVRAAAEQAGVAE